MFAIKEDLTDLKVKERSIFKILYSMNSHPVATPEMSVEDARCYILFFSEGPNLSAFIGLYLPRTDRKFFYVYPNNPFPVEGEKDVEEEARVFAEDMGFLLDEINVGGMAVEDRNQWIEEQYIFGYRKPGTQESAEEPVAEDMTEGGGETTPEATPEENRASNEDLIDEVLQPEPETPAVVIPQATEPLTSSIFAEAEPVPENGPPEPLPQEVQAPAHQSPEQVAPHVALEQPHPGVRQPAQESEQAQPEPDQHALASNRREPSEQPYSQLPAGPQAREYGQDQTHELDESLAPHVPQPSAPPHPAQQQQPAQEQKPATKKRTLQEPVMRAGTAEVEYEESVTVEMELERQSSVASKNVFETVPREQIIKLQKARETKVAPAGRVSRDKEALARLLASF